MPLFKMILTTTVILLSYTSSIFANPSASEIEKSVLANVQDGLKIEDLTLVTSQPGENLAGMFMIVESIDIPVPDYIHIFQTTVTVTEDFAAITNRYDTHVILAKVSFSKGDTFEGLLTVFSTKTDDGWHTSIFDFDGEEDVFDSDLVALSSLTEGTYAYQGTQQAYDLNWKNNSEFAYARAAEEARRKAELKQKELREKNLREQKENQQRIDAILAERELKRQAAIAQRKEEEKQRKERKERRLALENSLIGTWVSTPITIDNKVFNPQSYYPDLPLNSVSLQLEVKKERRLYGTFTFFDPHDPTIEYTGRLTAKYMEDKNQFYITLRDDIAPKLNLVHGWILTSENTLVAQVKQPVHISTSIQKNGKLLNEKNALKARIIAAREKVAADRILAINTEAKRRFALSKKLSWQEFSKLKQQYASKFYNNPEGEEYEFEKAVQRALIKLQSAESAQRVQAWYALVDKAKPIVAKYEKFDDIFNVMDDPLPFRLAYHKEYAALLYYAKRLNKSGYRYIWGNGIEGALWSYYTMQSKRDFKCLKNSYVTLSWNIETTTTYKDFYGWDLGPSSSTATELHIHVPKHVAKKYERAFHTYTIYETRIDRVLNGQVNFNLVAMERWLNAFPCGSVERQQLENNLLEYWDYHTMEEPKIWIQKPR